MADLTAIRNALAMQITARTGLPAHAQAPDSVSPPCAVIVPGNPLATYGITMDAALTLSLGVLVIVSDAPGAEHSQEALDACLGFGLGQAGSVPYAIQADPTLGGLVHYAEPGTVSQYGRVDWAGVMYFGAHLSVTVGTI